MNTDTSFFHRFWLRIGYRYVEENTLVPVIKHGRVVSFLGPGYHYRPGLGTSFGEPISTGLRLPPTLQVDAPTTDGLVVSVFVNIKYVFNPRLCRPDILSGLVTLSTGSMNNLVYDYVGCAVRAVCGHKTEAQLACGALWTELQREIRHTLQHELDAYGIGIRSDKAVAIVKIVPPPEIVRERVAARQRAIYAHSLQQQPPELAHDLHEQEIIRQGDFVHISLANSPASPRTNGLPITELLPAVPEFTRNGRHKHPN